MIFPCKAIHAVCTGNDIPRIASLTHGLVKTCMKKPHFPEKDAVLRRAEVNYFFPYTTPETTESFFPRSLYFSSSYSA